jgi:lipid-A-disaccharide synthase-like uncharacterized protein
MLDLREVSLLALGFLAQALFGLRLLIQWLGAERTKSSLPPVAFWYSSLAASGLFMLYGMLRHDWVILLGQCITYFVYWRNLHHLGVWRTLHLTWKLLVIAIPLLFVVIGLQQSKFEAPIVFNAITTLGFIGQGLLNVRFIYQWVHLEKNKEASLPPLFWWLSIFGSTLVLGYGLNHPTRGIDWVLALSQALGLLVYIRNLILINKTAPSAKSIF